MAGLLPRLKKIARLSYQPSRYVIILSPCGYELIVFPGDVALRSSAAACVKDRVSFMIRTVLVVCGCSFFIVTITSRSDHVILAFSYGWDWGLFYVYVVTFLDAE